MPQHFDLIIRNATIIDGARTPRFAGDIGIQGERITAVGRLDDARAEREIDASGKVAAPGFIDSHTHDERYLRTHPDMTPKVSQGVTTVIAGMRRPRHVAENTAVSDGRSLSVPLMNDLKAHSWKRNFYGWWD